LYNWEVAGANGKILHYGSCHFENFFVDLGSCHLENHTFGKLPFRKLHFWEVFL